MTLNRSTIYSYLEIVSDPEETTVNPCREAVPSARNRIQRRLSCAALQSKIYVVANFGTVEFCQNKPVCPKDGRFQFNTNVVFDSEGNIVARYHKQNLFFEDQFNVPPKVERTVFKGRFGQFGTFTCFDILFEKPAIDLVEEVGVQNIAFPTAWQNVMPLMFTLGFHESWAIRMGVNLLSAEVHIPEVEMQGSAIYSSGKGALVFFNDDMLLSSGKLVITNVTAPPPGPTLAPVYMPSNAQAMVPKETFISFMEGDPYVFTRLTGEKGQVFLEFEETRCYLKYTMGEYGDDVFGFGIFQGLHQSELNSYVQVCALVRCANSSVSSCGQATRTSTTKFKSVVLSGQFASNYIFPAVLVEGANPSKKDWTFHLDKKNNRGEIDFGSERSPLVSAILYTRLYDRDNKTSIPDYKNPSSEQRKLEKTWHVDAIGDISQINHQSSHHTIKIIGVVLVIGTLSCIIIGIVVVKKRRKYQHYTRL